MTSCFNSYIYFRLGISELDLHLPSPIFLCGLSLPLILKSLSKPKCIALQIIYTLITSLQKLTWVMSGVHQWKICPWMINYFNRAADRKINTYASLCRIMTLIWELVWALGDVNARGRIFQEGWLWTRSMILFLPPENCSCKCSEILFYSH